MITTVELMVASSLIMIITLCLYSGRHTRRSLTPTAVLSCFHTDAYSQYLFKSILTFSSVDTAKFFRSFLKYLKHCIL